MVDYINKRDVKRAASAAKKKLELMLRLEAELLTDLPAAYMEVYEMLAIARVMKMGREEPDQYRDKAKELSIMFGDKFVHEFNVKLNEILYGK